MKRIFALAVACTLATSAFAQDASTQLTLFSIKNGETLPIYRTTAVSYHCEPIFLGVDGLDVLEGSSELSLKFELHARVGAQVRRALEMRRHASEESESESDSSC
jgi:hypothetical protein